MSTVTCTCRVLQKKLISVYMQNDICVQGILPELIQNEVVEMHEHTCYELLVGICSHRIW